MRQVFLGKVFLAFFKYSHIGDSIHKLSACIVKFNPDKFELVGEKQSFNAMLSYLLLHFSGGGERGRSGNKKSISVLISY